MHVSYTMREMHVFQNACITCGKKNISFTYGARSMCLMYVLLHTFNACFTYGKHMLHFLLCTCLCSKFMAYPLWLAVGLRVIIRRIMYNFFKCMSFCNTAFAVRGKIWIL